jgi:hypothetical protein
MRKLVERLFNWCGRKIYGKANWPPLIVLVLTPRKEREIEDEEPRVFH